MSVGHSSDQVPVNILLEFSAAGRFWTHSFTGWYLLFLMDPLQQTQQQCKLFCVAHLTFLGQCGGVASSIRKFVPHPSEKMLAGFACGSISVGSEAETIQFVVCKMGSTYRRQWLLVTNVLGGDLEKSQPVSWASRTYWWFCQRLLGCWFPAVVRLGGCTPESPRVGWNVDLSVANRWKWIYIALT